ncbi:IS110 family transposase [Azospirillum brasilense]|nr:IS110 family transposase [Azospirillum brasilense]
MTFVGIDIGAEAHAAAAVNDQGSTVCKPFRFTADQAGHAALFTELERLAPVQLVVLEATGHYWKNLAAALVARDLPVAILNPLQSARFQQEALVRTKTDALDALGLARLGQQKRPLPATLPDHATEQLRELIRHRDRLVQDCGDRVRQLHRLLDLTFPEFKHHVALLDTALALTILKAFPTAADIAAATPRRLAKLRHGPRHFVGDPLARQLIAAAKQTVAAQSGDVYRVRIRHACEDLALWRARLLTIDTMVEALLEDHQVARLLTSIEGIGTTTAARLVAELDDPARFRSPEALACYIGLVPALKHSGKQTPKRAGLSPIGKAALRRALWMPTVHAVHASPWLRAFYDGLRARGKPGKVALIAAMRKLMVAIWTVAKQRRAWSPSPPQETTA